MSEYGEVRGSAFVPTQEELARIADRACQLYDAISALENKYRGLELSVDVFRQDYLGGDVNHIVSGVSYSLTGGYPEIYR